MQFLRTFITISYSAVVFGKLSRVQVIITLAEELSLQRVSIACKLDKHEYANLKGSSNFTFSVPKSLTDIFNQRSWESGSGIICHEDFAHSATLGLLSSDRFIGVANMWLILHRNDSLLNSVKLSLSQRVAFVNLETGVLQESYYNGKRVIQELGPLSHSKKVIISNASRLAPTCS